MGELVREYVIIIVDRHTGESHTSPGRYTDLVSAHQAAGPIDDLVNQAAVVVAVHPREGGRTCSSQT